MSRQNREEMIARVDEWQRSSMSAGAFARKFGFSKSTLVYWIRKVRDTAKSADDCHRFIEMRPSVLSNPLVEAKAQSEILANPQMVLTFPSGLCLKIYG